MGAHPFEVAVDDAGLVEVRECGRDLFDLPRAAVRVSDLSATYDQPAGQRRKTHDFDAARIGDGFQVRAGRPVFHPVREVCVVSLG
jgi:hypothetical protein